MISKKHADTISNSLIEAKRREQRDKNFKRLNFIYGYMLGADIIEQYSHSPGVIKQAVKSAQNSWQVGLIFSILVVLSVCSFIFLEEPLNLLIGFIVILGGGGMVNKLVRSKAIRFLNENLENI